MRWSIILFGGEAVQQYGKGGGGVQTMKSLRVKFRISNNDFIMHEHFLSNLYLHII